MRNEPLGHDRQARNAWPRARDSRLRSGGVRLLSDEAAWPGGWAWMLLTVYVGRVMGKMYRLSAGARRNALSHRRLFIDL